MTTSQELLPAEPPAQPKAGFSFAKWWDDHKEEKNSSRRTKYRTNPEYRGKVKKQNAESRARRAQDAKAAQQAESDAKTYRTSGCSWKMFDVEVEVSPGVKQMIPAVTIGALAAATNRSVQGLRLWEAKGVIPQPNATSPRGDRLYTVALVEQIVNDLRAKGRLKPTRRQGRGTPKVEKTVRFADGTERPMVLLQVAAVALVLQRSNVAVQAMESRGVIPPTPLRATSREYRLYTVDQIASLQKRFEELGHNLRSQAAQRQFHDRVKADWEKQGIYGATIVDGEAKS